MSSIVKTLKTHKAVMPQFLGYSLFFVCVLAVACVLIYQYWYGENGYFELDKLTKELSHQLEINEQQQQKNSRLAADVKDLKTGLVAIEEHARVDLGLIRAGEMFVQVADTNLANQSDIPKIKNEPDAVETAGVLSDELNPIDENDTDRRQH